MSLYAKKKVYKKAMEFKEGAKKRYRSANRIYYRGKYFRSELECKFYIWIRDLFEKVEYEPITFKDNEQFYTPDFLIDDEFFIEVKPFSKKAESYGKIKFIDRLPNHYFCFLFTEKDFKLNADQKKEFEKHKQSQVKRNCFLSIKHEPYCCAGYWRNPRRFEMHVNRQHKGHYPKNKRRFVLN